jgi:hypothetical protein
MQLGSTKFKSNNLGVIFSIIEILYEEKGFALLFGSLKSIFFMYELGVEESFHCQSPFIVE